MTSSHRFDDSPAARVPCLPWTPRERPRSARPDPEPRAAPLLVPDDGWTIASLCAGCARNAPAQTAPGRLRYETTNGVADDIDTDEDHLIALGF